MKRLRYTISFEAEAPTEAREQIGKFAEFANGVGGVIDGSPLVQELPNEAGYIGKDVITRTGARVKIADVLPFRDLMYAVAYENGETNILSAEELRLLYGEVS